MLQWLACEETVTSTSCQWLRMIFKVYFSEGRVDRILFFYCSVYCKLITTYAGAFAESKKMLLLMIADPCCMHS